MLNSKDLWVYFLEHLICCELPPPPGRVVQLTEEGVPRAPLLCIADTAEPVFTLPCEDIIAAAGEPLATPEDLKPRLPGLTFLDDIFFQPGRDEYRKVNDFAIEFELLIEGQTHWMQMLTKATTCEHGSALLAECLLHKESIHGNYKNPWHHTDAPTTVYPSFT